jgi:two-component system, NtrC family, response regulator PilR
LQQSLAVAQTERPRALIVDDDATIRNLVRLVVMRENFDVETAADGLEAVLKLGMHDYELIMLDLMMPAISGQSVLEFLETERPELFSRVVIMTAAGDQEIERMLQGRDFTLLHKPFDITELSSIIRAKVAPPARSGDSGMPVG